ncbi:MAG: substrate-binding domain-containing protein [Devosia sp.]|uniref:substrate-binding domain-containing protein n=1 Tax=Devosia sp. TaxID=1871048 RepID=UPI001A5E80CE|nr:substrate-binding domain-containing protein [Devosia sp.]MBL8597499.1 substrate-binding domain-containing protein [Devosia sp.]
MKITHLSAVALAAVMAVSAPLAAKAQDDQTIIMLGGPSSDPFWGAVQQGFNTAVEELGVKGQWTAPADFNDIVPVYTRMFEAAIARKPAAIAVGNFFPEPTEPLIKQAAEQGIPVIIINSGGNKFKELGAIGFIGEDSYQMGYEGGKVAVGSGVKNGLCINQIAANPVLELRCKGYIEAVTEAGGTAKMVTLASEDIGNSQKVQAAVSAMLMQDQTIDGVITLGVAVAVDALESIRAVRATGRSVDLGTMDLGNTVLEAIEAGEMSFASDQQPLLQGYYGVLIPHLYNKYQMAPSNVVWVGPYLVTKDNAAAVLKVNKDFAGSRGAN